MLLLTVFAIFGVVTCNISLQDCGFVKHCHKRPERCTTTEDCDIIVTWQPNTTNPTDTIYFEVATKKSSGYAWIANSLNSEIGRMAGSSGELCIFDGNVPKLRGFDAIARGMPPSYHDNTVGVALHSMEMIDGTLICRYSRSITPTSAYMKALNESYYVVNAYGTTLQNNDRIGQHNGGDYHFSNQKLVISSFEQKTPPPCLLSSDIQRYCYLMLPAEVFLCKHIKPAPFVTMVMSMSTSTIPASVEVSSKKESDTVFSTVLSAQVYECSFSASRKLPTSTLTSMSMKPLSATKSNPSPMKNTISATVSATKSSYMQLTTSAIKSSSRVNVYPNPTTVTYSVVASLIASNINTAVEKTSKGTNPLNITPTSISTASQTDTGVIKSHDLHNLNGLLTALPSVLPSSIAKYIHCVWDTCKDTKMLAQRSHGQMFMSSYIILLLSVTTIIFLR